MKAWIELKYDDELLRELAPHSIVGGGMGLSSLVDDGIEVVTRVLAHTLVHSQLRVTQEAEELPLLGTQIGVPHVDDQHDPTACVVVVPRLVLEGVVKDKALAFLRIDYLITCSKSTLAFWNHQRQMTPKLFVGRPVVLPDVCTWRQRREKRMLILSVNGFDNGSSLRTQLSVRSEVHIVQEQVEHVPVPSVVASTPQSVPSLTLHSKKHL